MGIQRIVLPLLLALAGAVKGDVRLPRLLSDHMLLQRQIPVRIWGWADPAEPVVVEFSGQVVKGRADAAGYWAVYLAPMEAGGPFQMNIQGRNKISIEDVLVGDVWVASGQSNMVWPVNRSNRAEQEIAAANYPQIRLFAVAAVTSEFPLEDVSGAWSPCTPEKIARMSAVAYFFARHLHGQIGVPIGVIQSAWGATPGEAWTSSTALANDPGLASVSQSWTSILALYPEAKRRYDRQLKEWEAAVEKAKAEGQKPPPKPAEPLGPGNQRAPGVLFNAMIAPLTPYAIRGVIWYQGESNTSVKRFVYRRLFQTLIEDWRRAWNQGDFPFLFVQLASFNPGPGGGWPDLREAQTAALQLRNTGMAVAIDIGDANDIHPKNKQDVGLRLGRAARAIAYGEKIVYSGPMFKQLTREGDALRVWFDHAGGGVVNRGGDLKGFVIAGADRKFVPAQARIEKNTVVVSSPAVAEPVAVRYAWEDNPDCNLYSAEGLPASPFRSDRWAEVFPYR